MITQAEGLAIARASTGWLAGHLGTTNYDEIEAQVQAILAGEQEPPPALLEWAKAVAEVEAQRSRQTRPAQPDYHYTTPPVCIGKHEWRLVVLDFWLDPSKRCTQYHWRRVGDICWKPGRDWPSYDGDDGMFGGLPRSLLPKVYQPNKNAIEAALADQPQPADPQLTFFSSMGEM